MNMNMNTVLLIEPRMHIELPSIINEYIRLLGKEWKYVFYCGKNAYHHWKNILDSEIEIRILNLDNFTAKEYNDFVKRRELWESLYGDFVLIIQLDTWIMNTKPYDIDYFLKLNKSYIGGNMYYKWHEFERENINFQYMNFNGGLSLRKREDMIKVIDHFPPLPNIQKSTNIAEDAEDVYFTIGCYKLGLPIGNDEECSHFALHTIYKDPFFGIHNPISITIKEELNLNYPDLKYKNPFLHL